MRIMIEEVVGGGWMVLVDGIQHGGKRDTSGAGDLTFNSKTEAIVYADDLRAEWTDNRRAERQERQYRDDIDSACGYLD